MPHIFAIGEVVGQPALAYKAVHEAHVAVEVMAGGHSWGDYPATTLQTCNLG